MFRVGADVTLTGWQTAGADRDIGVLQGMNTLQVQTAVPKYEGCNFNSGNYLFTTDTKQIHVSKFYCPSV